MATDRALLLIADIGGYTEYMDFHRSILGHAEAATRRMLDKIVDAARDFDLIEIEGDAAFLSRDAAGLDGPAMLAVVTDAAVAMHVLSTRSVGSSSSTCAPAGAARGPAP